MWLHKNMWRQKWALLGKFKSNLNRFQTQLWLGFVYLQAVKISQKFTPIKMRSTSQNCDYLLESYANFSIINYQYLRGEFYADRSRYF